VDSDCARRAQPIARGLDRTPSRTHLQGGVQQARNVGRSAQNRNGKVGETEWAWTLATPYTRPRVPLHAAPLDIVRRRRW